jgi:hypothetical protein
MRKFNDVDFKASDNRDWSKKDRHKHKITGIDTSDFKVGPVYLSEDGTFASDIPIAPKFAKADFHEKIVLPKGSSEYLNKLYVNLCDSLIKK